MTTYEHISALIRIIERNLQNFEHPAGREVKLDYLNKLRRDLKNFDPSLN